MSTQYRIKAVRNGVNQVKYYPMYKWYGMWRHCTSWSGYEGESFSVYFWDLKEAEEYLDKVELERLTQLKTDEWYIEYVPKTDK